jgi:hypothetical protein
MVDECNSELTGVGPAIASGSHVCNGNWPLLPMAAMNSAIAATFIFYIIHAVTDGYLYLFLLVLFMLVVSWILLLTKLHDLSLRQHQPTKQFMLMNFGLPIIGTFYSFIKLTQK